MCGEYFIVQTLNDWGSWCEAATLLTADRAEAYIKRKQLKDARILHCTFTTYKGDTDGEKKEEESDRDQLFERC